MPLYNRNDDHIRSLSRTEPNLQNNVFFFGSIFLDQRFLMRHEELLRGSGNWKMLSAEAITCRSQLMRFLFTTGDIARQIYRVLWSSPARVLFINLTRMQTGAKRVSHRCIDLTVTNVHCGLIEYTALMMWQKWSTGISKIMFAMREFQFDFRLLWQNSSVGISRSMSLIPSI